MRWDPSCLLSVVLLTQFSSGISLDLIIFAWPTLTVTFYFLLCLADAYGHLYFLLCLADAYGHLVFSSGFYLQTSCLFIFSDACGHFLLLIFLPLSSGLLYFWCLHFAHTVSCSSFWAFCRLEPELVFT